MSQKHIFLSVLLFQEPGNPGVWVAQALERDIAAYGPDIDAATRAFAKTLGGYFVLADREKRDVLSSLRPAPDLFWEHWRALIASQPNPAPAESVQTLPAFMIRAVSHEPLSTSH